MGKGNNTSAKRWLWAGLGAVVLALVVFFGGALAFPDTDEPSLSTTLSPELTAVQLADDAHTALSSNDTETAVGLAQQALKLDAANEQARSVIAQVAAKPVPAPAAEEQPAEPADDADAAEDPDDSAYLAAVDDIETLLPAKVRGWGRGQTAGTSTDALVTYQPEAGSANDSVIKRSVYSVHDMKSQAKAEKFVSGVTKATYPNKSAWVSLPAVKKAYFGTNGFGGATVAFSRGRYAFELLVVAEQDVDPASLKKTAVSLAAAFPAAD